MPICRSTFRLTFCQEFFNRHREARHDQLMTVEANFHLDSVVNKQTFRYKGDENREKCLQKISTVQKSWFGVVQYYLVSLALSFFEDENNRSVTVNSESYIHTCKQFVCGKYLFHEETTQCFVNVALNLLNHKKNKKI